LQRVLCQVGGNISEGGCAAVVKAVLTPELGERPIGLANERRGSSSVPRYSMEPPSPLRHLIELGKRASSRSYRVFAAMVERVGWTQGAAALIVTHDLRTHSKIT
jgi:hypothetical protein